MVKHAAADDGEMLRYIGEIEEVLAQVGAEKGASDPVSKFLDYCADARRVIEDSSGTTVDGNSIRQQIAEGFNGMREILEIALSEIRAPEDQKWSSTKQTERKSSWI
jgi:hypothetical protein